jgi:hypothetical protein
MSSELMTFLRGILSEKSTRDCILAPDPPPIPLGQETYCFEVGETYFKTAVSRYKTGTPVNKARRFSSQDAADRHAEALGLTNYGLF